MARRPRSSRAWHFVLSAARRDADARAVALAGATNWGYDSDGQHSDSDSEPECSSLPPSIPSAVPVTGESFCGCDGQSEAPFCGSLHATRRGLACRCGEEDEHFDWVWDDGHKSSATLLSCEDRQVHFHTEYSCGTAAVRGTKELAEGQHFWEIKMTSPVYGTDMMVGIGTAAVDLDKYHHTFCSLLGCDEDSWGLSYTGLHHRGAPGHLARHPDLLQEQEVHRCGGHEAAQPEALPDGVLHGGAQQHEDHPLLRQPHLPAVPVLPPPAPAAARLRGHARGPAAAARPQAGAARRAGLGPAHELRPPRAARAARCQQPRERALPAEALPTDLRRLPGEAAAFLALLLGSGACT
ncbi:SPRY domain-containing SOCS box protein 3 isoform X2 [Dasypus novemcinctus]|uniref:SPRY domain-containing SOCS box protein 3 isoform X2 n=1 Tax=Dasypus novemcinctus TaxID=9361 RepID=UPI00265E8072|nr:SPRY domain-containing SOCS box protein 3 isoform X2 [Dasypus novemcinctus]